MNPLADAIGGAVGGIVKPIANIFVKKSERKQAIKTAQAKILQAQVEGQNEITLQDREWEAIMAQKTDSTWKDEYVTVIITSPIIGLIAGAVWTAFTGDTTLLTGTKDALVALKQAGIDMGVLMQVVVYAAVGLKFVKGVVL